MAAVSQQPRVGMVQGPYSKGWVNNDPDRERGLGRDLPREAAAIVVHLPDRSSREA